MNSQVTQVQKLINLGTQLSILGSGMDLTQPKLALKTPFPIIEYTVM
jgi:hypothetical protein